MQKMLKTLYVTFCCTVLVSGNYGSLQGDTLDLNSNEDVLQDVLERLQSLESKYHRQADDNTQLRKTVTDLEAQISSLKNENQQFREQITVLQTRDQLINEAFSDLLNLKGSPVKNDQERNEEIEELVKEVTIIESDGDPMATKGDALVKMSDYLKQQTQVTDDSGSEISRHLQKRENEVNVAFFAAIGEHHLYHLGANQTVVFDHVITNVGNAYNNHAGDFRAPVGGTYVFSVTMMSLTSGTVHCQMFKNGNGIAKIYVFGAKDATSSMTAVLELKQGEDIVIKNQLTDVTVHGYGYTYFSGFLLYQDDSVPAIVGK